MLITEYKRYDTTLENVKKTLNTYGVATLPNILSEDECIALRTAMWSEVSYVTKGRFNIDDPKTWREFYNFYPLHSMLIQHWSLGHSLPVWDVRQNERVAEVFAKLWKVSKEDLVVSFDGLSMHLPPEQTKKGWYRGNTWLHTDQSPQKVGFHCVQALINLYPVRKGDVTLSLLEGSHKYHQSFFEHIGKEDEKDDWYKMDKEEYEYFLEKGCERHHVEADIGSMVLWDSRTMHQGMEPLKDREGENMRMVFYVCMMPRSQTTPAILKKRKKAFEELRIVNHWANKPKLFPKQPRTYGNPLPDLNPIHPPVLTAFGKRLVGY
jgi:ectoine hydroxylase-related dioxygenase (phytanoyl-CoA dioxygenase family)